MKRLMTHLKLTGAILTAILTLLPAGAVAAILSAQVLRDDRVMVRLTPDRRYLLLPVEESRPNSRIRVIRDNRSVTAFNIRLSKDRVDYFVPLDVQQIARRADGAQAEAGADGLLLDIYVARGEAQGQGAGVKTQDFLFLKEMKMSDTFDTTNREKYRPLYHHTPPYGWMNDPNGLFYKDGTWHLYFQRNPFGSQWENMHWGHSTSTDLVNWTFRGDAIAPDDLGTIWSGSAVVDKEGTAGFGRGAVVAFYTSAGAVQKQCMAWSNDDGLTFTKYPLNPVLVSTCPDFRDPHVFWYDEGRKWIMIVSEKQHIKLFSSPDLKQWTWESDFGEGYGSHDGTWECPDLFRLTCAPVGGKSKDRGRNLSNGRPEEKWILICNVSPGGPFGGSATQYFTGHFDGHRFTCDSDPKVTKWMDYGKDHYATVTFDNAPDGRRVALPWMSNWQYADRVPTFQYRSANGLPRDLGCFEYQGQTCLSVRPSPEILAAFSATPQRSLSPACRIDVRLRGNDVITLANTHGEEIVMRYDATTETFTMDRTKSGNIAFSKDFPTVTKAPTRGKIRTLQIFLDRSSIEVFDAEGKMAMSNIIFPSEPYNRITVRGGKATIYGLK